MIKRHVFNMELPAQMTKEEEKELYNNWSKDSWKVLVERNIRLAIYFANKWRQTGIDQEELLSLAFLGMIKAAKAFRPELGYEFNTFAGHVVKNEILLEIRRQKKQKLVYSTDNIFINDNDGEEYTVDELFPSHDQVEEVVILTELINELPTQQRNIIKMRYSGYTQSEIAMEMGLSQTYISRLLKDAKSKITN